MRIEKVLLNNFISHEKSEVEFKGEVNVIIGPNGAGKSSIIDAIVFGLFREQSRGVVENLIRRGMNRSSVTLILTDDKNKILIERNISKGNSSIEDRILVNGKPIAYGAKNVSNELEKILGIDKDVALSTVIVKQDELDKILDNFQDTMNSILKLELIEKLIDSKGPIAEFIKKLENKLEILNSYELQYNDIRKKLEEKEKRVKTLKEEILKINKEIEEFEREYQKLNNEFQILENKREEYIKTKTSLEERKKLLNKLKEEIERLEKETKELPMLEKEIEELEKLKDIKRKIEKYELLLTNYEELKENISDLEKEIEEIEKNINRKKEIEPYYRKYISLQDDKNKLEKEYNIYRELKGKKDSKLQSLERLKGELQKISFNPNKINELENKINELEKTKSNLEQKNGEIQSMIRENLEIINNIKSVKTNRCPVCGRPIDNEHRNKIIEEANLKVEELRKEKGYIESRLKEIILELNKAKLDYKKNIEEKAKYEKIIIQIKEYEEDISRLDKELEKLGDIEKTKNEIEKELEKLKDYYDEYLKLSKFSEDSAKVKKDKLIEYKRKKDAIEKELMPLKIELEGIKKDEIEKRVNELEKKRVKIEYLKGLKSRLDKDLEDYQNLMNEIEILERKLIEISFDENKYNILKNSLEILQNNINGKKLEKSRKEGELNSEINEITNLKNQLNNLEEQLKSREKIQNAINKLRKIREALGENRLQSYIIMATKQIIENNLNDIISKFDLSIKNVEIELAPKSGKSRSSKGGIIVYTNNGEQLPIVSLSGGEKIAISLALRLAIARTLMANVNFFILDEPTVNLDELRKTYLVDIIKGIKETVPQIIIVTHDEEILAAADYVIRVEKRGNKSIVREET